jgi:hypothetical protein
VVQKITKNLVTADEALRRSIAELEAEDAAAPATVAPAIDSQWEQSGRAFSWLAILTPTRIWNEDVGDALETIHAMERAGCSRFQIRVKIVTTYLWVLVAIVRELVAAATGRKSPNGVGGK